MPTIDVVRTGAADRPLLEQLWHLFRHDMSRYTHALPDAGGRYPTGRLDAALTEPTWRSYLIRLDDAPVGLGLVRGLEAEERVLTSFFIVHGARGHRVGLTAARTILQRHPGRWAIAHQEANRAAGHFWRRVATDVAGSNWAEELRPVPNRPDLPADCWITLRT